MVSIMMKNKKRILVIDDERDLRDTLQLTLRKNNYFVDTVPDGKVALQMIAEKDYAFIFCDLYMPVIDGAGFLKNAIKAGVNGTIIMMTEQETVNAAIECVKQGAYDYILKPFNHDEIMLVLNKAEELERLKSENLRLKEGDHQEYSFASLASRNQRMLEIFSLVRDVRDINTSLLILGEPGTGKEHIARVLHFNSRRKNAPFVAVNCGVISNKMLESELFGHVSGTFNNSLSGKGGLFELADGGTIFLNEIDEMPLPLQTKLLRLLQEGEISRGGGGNSKKIDVRLICASSRCLEEMVARSRFRKDLYSELNTLSIYLPPLRERREDVPLLVAQFLQKHGKMLGRPQVHCPNYVMRIFMNYHWPGNVKELENCIHSMLLLSTGDALYAGCLPGNLRRKSSLFITGGKPLEVSAPAVVSAKPFSLKLASEKLEKEMIRQALQETCGNRTHAAKLLEISHRAMLYKLKDYGIK
jgi:two-component system response regulator AtoC